MSKTYFDMGKNTPKNPTKTWINLDLLGGGPPQVGKLLSTDKMDALAHKTLTAMGVPDSMIGKADVEAYMAASGMSSERKERFKKEYMMQPLGNPQGDYPEDHAGSAKSKRAEELLRMVDTGVISKRQLADSLGVDWKAEMHKLHKLAIRKGAKNKRDREKQKEAESSLQPFFEWQVKTKETGWFKRGDVARVLKITPKKAGAILHAVNERSVILSTNDGWWYYAPPRRQNESNFGSTYSSPSGNTSQPQQAVGMTPVQPSKIYNVFGGK